MTSGEFDALLGRIQDGSEVGSVRSALLDRIDSSLTDHLENLGRWEKDHLAGALGALQWNIGHDAQPSNWWLRCCLLNIWKAEIPREQRSEYQSSRDTLLDTITYGDFKTEIENLRGRIAELRRV